MKVGIITYFDTTNYGANLQAYALQEAIRKLGFDSEIINYIPYNIKVRELPYINFRGTFRNLLGSIYRYHRINLKYKQLHKFVTRYDNLSISYSKNTLSNSNGIYDKFIVGSDILWSFDINGGDTSLFLDFVYDDTKKYSYATSIGTKWNEIEAKIANPYLKKFNKIAVREREAVEWVYDSCGREAKLVCDPTMLITTSEWEQFCSAKVSNHPYVLIYMPTNKCLADARKFAIKENLEVITIRQEDGIEDFLTKIKNARFVFTGSYHGFLFSLYFHRNLAYYIFQDASRLQFLGETFKLSLHEFTSKEFILPDNPDWNYIDHVMSDFRFDSINYLRGILEE